MYCDAISSQYSKNKLKIKVLLIKWRVKFLWRWVLFNIGFDDEGIVKVYNSCESEMAGLLLESVIDEDLFNTVAPCMNNFLVAQKFEDAIDEKQT